MTTSHRSSTRTTARRASLRALVTTPVALAAVALGTVPVAASTGPALPASPSSDTVVGLLGADGDDAARAEAEGRDARLRPGCRPYPLRYVVEGAGDDWLLELVVRDRSGEDVASVSLHGVESPRRGRTTVTLCRAAVEAGRFAVGGVLTERAGYEQVEHPVERDRFWLTRR